MADDNPLSDDEVDQFLRKLADQIAKVRNERGTETEVGRKALMTAFSGAAAGLFMLDDATKAPGEPESPPLRQLQ